jgi:hypothetical protein
MGPSGQPGWWGRMNAGESPRNQGRSVWPPLSVSRRRSRGLRKLPQWSAARRAGPRYGSAVPSRWRDRPCRKAGQWVGDPARDFRRSATLCMEVAKGSKPTIWTEARRDAPRGNAPARNNTCTEKRRCPDQRRQTPFHDVLAKRTRGLRQTPFNVNVATNSVRPRESGDPGRQAWHFTFTFLQAAAMERSISV